LRPRRRGAAALLAAAHIDDAIVLPKVRARGGRINLYRVVVLIGLLTIWEVATVLANSRLFPTPDRVFMALFSELQKGTLPAAFVTSLGAFALGAGLALVLGSLLGLAIGYSKELDNLLAPFINAAMVLPSIAYIPVILVILGVGFPARVAVVFEYAFLVIAINTQAGVQSVDHSLVEMGRSFGLRRVSLFRKVILPAAVPGVFSGLRLAVGRSVKGMVNAEVMIAIVGLGGLVKTYGQRFEMDKLLAVVIALTAFSMLLTIVVGRLDRYVNRWNRSAA
jgi:NitT/TauT family transport system permease protein